MLDLKPFSIYILYVHNKKKYVFSMWDNFFYLNTSTSKHNIISFKYEIKKLFKIFF
jgi:hypothetical protein